MNQRRLKSSKPNRDNWFLSASPWNISNNQVLMNWQHVYIFRWNSWNHFGCKIDEATIQKIGKTGTPLFSLSLENQTKNKTYCVYVADAMVDTGLAKLGYEYINLGNRFAFLAFFGFPLFQLFMFRNEACNIHSGYVCSETADDCWAAYNRDSQVTSTTTCWH